MSEEENSPDKSEYKCLCCAKRLTHNCDDSTIYNYRGCPDWKNDTVLQAIGKPIKQSAELLRAMEAVQKAGLTIAEQLATARAAMNAPRGMPTTAFDSLPIDRFINEGPQKQTRVYYWWRQGAINGNNGGVKTMKNNCVRKVPDIELEVKMVNEDCQKKFIITKVSNMKRVSELPIEYYSHSPSCYIEDVGESQVVHIKGWNTCTRVVVQESRLSEEQFSFVVRTLKAAGARYTAINKNMKESNKWNGHTFKVTI